MASTPLSISAALSAYAGNKSMTAVSISDAAMTNVQLDQVQTLVKAGKVTAISLSSTTPLTITAAQVTSAASTLAKINVVGTTPTYTLAVTNALGTNLSSLASNTRVTSITLDPAANNTLAYSQYSSTIANKLSTSGLTITGVSYTDTMKRLAADSDVDFFSLATTSISGTNYKIAGLAAKLIGANTVTSVAAADAASMAANANVGAITLSSTSITAAQYTAAAAAKITTAGLTVSAASASDAIRLGSDPDVAKITFATATTLTQGEYSAIASKITNTGSSAVTVTGVAVADAADLALDTHVGKIAISDTTDNVADNFSLLTALSTKLGAITLSDSVPGFPLNLALSVSNIVGDLSVLKNISSPITISVSDTSANIAAKLDSLQSLGDKVSIITQTGSPTKMSLSAVTIGKDLATLNKIIGSYAVAVSDSSANIAKNLDALQAINSKIVTIAQYTSTKAALAITATQYKNDADVLAKMNAAGYTLTVSGVKADSAATIAADAHVISVTLADTTLTQSQFTAALAGKVSNTGLTITGVAADKAAALSGDSHIGTITLATNTLTAAQYTVTLAEKLVGTTGLTITGVLVADAAALAIDPLVEKITLASEVLSLTSMQFGSIAAKLTNIDLTVTNVLASDVSNLASNSHVSKINIVDSLKNITSHFPDLIAAMNAGDLGTITLSDPTDLEVQASDLNPNFIGGVPILNQLATHFTNIPEGSVTISGVPVIQNASGNVGTYAYAYALLNFVDKVILSNSWTDLQGNPVSAGIYADAPANTIHKNLPWVPYSAYVGHAKNIDKIYAADGITPAMTKVNDVLLLASVYSLLANDPSLYGVSLLGANTSYTYYSNYVDFHIGSLGTSKLVVLDTPASIFDSNFTLNTASVTTYQVKDTAANIALYAGNLDEHLESLASITVTDLGNVVHISRAAYAADQDVFDLLAQNNGYQFVIDEPAGLTVAEALAYTGTDPINVSDIGSNISAHLIELKNMGVKLDEIAQTDTAPLALAWNSGGYSDGTPGAYINSYTDVLAKFTSAYSFVLTGVSANDAANLSNYISNSYPLYSSIATNLGLTKANWQTVLSSLSVSDSASSLSGILDQLHSLNVAGKLGTVSIASYPGGGSGMQNMSISASQYINDADVLAKITGDYSLQISNASVTQALSFTGDSHLGNGAISIYDSAANIGNYLADLNAVASKISSVMFSNNSGSVSLWVTPEQLTDDSAILSKISGLGVKGITVEQALALKDLPIFGSINSLYIKDTGINIAAHLSELKSLGGMGMSKIAGIEQTDLVATQYAISDSGADIASNLDGFQAIVGQLSSIAVNDGNAQLPMSLNITASQFVNDQTVLGKLTGDYILSVSNTTISQLPILSINSHVRAIGISDSAANIVENLAKLQDLGSVLTGVSIASPMNNMYGTPAVLTVSADQLTTYATVLAKLSGVGMYSSAPTIAVYGVTAADATAVAATNNVNKVLVVDTAANIAAAQANLQMVGSGELAGVYASDTRTLTGISASDLLALERPELYTGQSSPTLNLLAQAGIDSTSIDTMISSFGVADSLNNIVNNSNTLATLRTLVELDEISQITLTDQSSGAGPYMPGMGGGGDSRPNTWISISNLLANADVFAKINGDYTLTLNPATVAQILEITASTIYQTLDTNGHIRSLQLNDTAANIGAHLDALQDLGNKLSSISPTDMGKIWITADQVSRDSDMINKMMYSTSLGVVAHNPSSDELAALQSNNKVSYIFVVDTAANIADLEVTTMASMLPMPGMDSKVMGKLASDGDGSITFSAAANFAQQIDALQIIKANSWAPVNSIILTDGASSSMAMSTAQYFANAEVIATLTGSYSFNLGGMSIAQVVSLTEEQLSHIGTLTISDTTSNIISNLEALNDLSTHIDSITPSYDPGSMGMPKLVLSADQLTSNASILAKIPSHTPITVLASIDELAGLASNSSVFSVFVVDTHSNIAAHTSDLNTLGSKLAGVYESDTLALSHVSGNTVQTLVGGNSNLMMYATPASDALAKLGINAGNWQSLSTISVADMQMALGGNKLDALHIVNLAGKLGTITIVPSNSGNTYSDSINLSYAQYIQNSDVLAKISGNYAISFNQLTAEQAIALSSDPHIQSTSIQDSAQNLFNHLDDLQSVNDLISNISVPYGGAYPGNNTIYWITPAQSVENAPILAKMQNLSGAQIGISGLSADQALILGNFYRGGYSKFIVTDTFSNISDEQASLVSMGSMKILSMLVSDTPASLFNDDFAANTLSTSGINISYDVKDTAANIAAHAADLEAYLGTIASLTVSDPSNAVHISRAAYVADQGVFDLLAQNNGYQFVIDEPAEIIYSVADALLYQGSSAINVSDTLAHVSSSMSPLIVAMKAGQLGTITLSDPSTTTLTYSQLDIPAGISSNQTAAMNYVSDVNSLLSHVINLTPAGLTITGVPVTHPTSNTVYSDAWGLASLTNVAKVILTNSPTDGSFPWPSYSYYSSATMHKIFDNDGTTLARTKVNNVDTLVHLTDLLANDASVYGASLIASNSDTSYTTYVKMTQHGIGNLNGGLSTAKLIVLDTPANIFGNSFITNSASDTTYQIKDTAANIALYAGNLQAHLGSLASITVSDPSNVVHIPQATYTADRGVFDLLAQNNGYRFVVDGPSSYTDITIAQLKAITDFTGVTSVTVLDNSANVRDSAAISALKDLGAKLSHLTLSDYTGWGNGAFGSPTVSPPSFLSQVSNLGENSVTVKNFVLSFPATSHPLSLAKLSQIDKLLLSNSPGNNNFNWPDYLNNTFGPYSSATMHKIFANDGTTPAGTKVKNIDTMEHLRDLLANDSSVYGASLSATNSDTSYTTYAKMIQYHVGNISSLTTGASTAKLIVLDTPASVFGSSFILNTASVTTYQVKDTAANIALYAGNLEAHLNSLASITITDPSNTVHISRASYNADQAVFDLASTGGYQFMIDEPDLTPTPTPTPTVPVINTWIAPSSYSTTSDWATAANWSTGATPTANSDVIMGNTSNNATITSDAVAHSLTLSSGGLQINGGGNLTVGTDIVASSSSQIYLTGGSVTAQHFGNNLNINGYGSVAGNFGNGYITASGLWDMQSGTWSAGTLKVSGALSTMTTMTMPGGYSSTYSSNPYFGINSNATLELDSSVDFNSWINFNGSATTSETLRLNNPEHFKGTISNWMMGDTIDLVGISASSVSYNGSNLLTINETNGQTLTFNLSNASLTGTVAQIADDGHGGSVIGFVGVDDLHTSYAGGMF